MKAFYTVEEVANMIGKSVRTTRQYIVDGVLKGEKSNNKWIVYEEEIERYKETKNEN